jgi:cytochrome c-type biogenesis protein
MSWLPLPVAAFAAGIVSFLSPCVLPLVPGYISMISGVDIKELSTGGEQRQRMVMLHAVLFTVGFSLVFVALGAVAGALGQFAGRHMTALSQLAGAVIILFGLHLTGLVPIPALYRDFRPHALSSDRKSLHALLLGSAFALGWSPCVGPILAGILALAASKATLNQGVALLAIYSAGLAVPFLLTALGIRRFFGAYRFIRPHLRKIEVGAGALTVGMGTLVFTQHLTMVNSWLNGIPLFRSMAEHLL